MLLTVDPSLTCTGWAFFKGEFLAECGVSPTKKDWLVADRITRAAKDLQYFLQYHAKVEEVVFEWPEIYTKSPGNPNDLLYLSAIVGAIMHLTDPSRCTLVQPKQWKGQVPKKIHNQRMLGRLTPAEVDTFRKDMQGKAKNLHNNAIDAIGLGLWHLGRTGRGAK